VTPHSHAGFRWFFTASPRAAKFSLAHTIDPTESGAKTGSPQAWTNTLTDGTPGGTVADGNCRNWNANTTGNTGDTRRLDAFWTRIGNHPCAGAGTARGLYCFHQR
jgi:hypothetical protein